MFFFLITISADQISEALNRDIQGQHTSFLSRNQLRGFTTSSLLKGIQERPIVAKRPLTEICAQIVVNSNIVTLHCPSI